jgi:hypothetical protein
VTVARRILYRASSMQVLGSVLNGQLGVAARITALRRSSPTVSPQVPTLIAAEFPILAIEATLAALSSFTLVGPPRRPRVGAAGVLMTVTGTVGGLCFAAWSGGDQLWASERRRRSSQGSGPASS